MTRNDNLAAAVCAVGLALSAMPLDTLPGLAHFDVRADEHPDGHDPHVEAQLSATDDHAAALRGVLAWQAAMPAGATMRARALATSPGDWQVTARGRLGGLRFEVWTILDAVPRDVVDDVVGADPVATAAQLVQRLVDEPAGGAR